MYMYTFISNTTIGWYVHNYIDVYICMFVYLCINIYVCIHIFIYDNYVNAIQFIYLCICIYLLLTEHHHHR
jgi:hypothetical protein